MAKGIEVQIYLRPHLPDETFVASALGNLAAWTLASQRKEHLEWQVVRVDGGPGHHYRLIVRHPDRWLDLGVRSDLGRILEGLSNEDVASLERRLSAAKSEGLEPRPLRRVRDQVDFWQDNFWNSIG
jgi:hypothetical protein